MSLRFTVQVRGAPLLSDSRNLTRQSELDTDVDASSGAGPGSLKATASDKKGPAVEVNMERKDDGRRVIGELRISPRITPQDLLLQQNITPLESDDDIEDEEIASSRAGGSGGGDCGAGSGRGGTSSRWGQRARRMFVCMHMIYLYMSDAGVCFVFPFKVCGDKKKWRQRKDRSVTSIGKTYCCTAFGGWRRKPCPA